MSAVMGLVDQGGERLLRAWFCVKWHCLGLASEVAVGGWGAFHFRAGMYTAVSRKFRSVSFCEVVAFPNDWRPSPNV